MINEVEQYINEHIPIVKKHNFQITEEVSPFIQVKGTLKDHINHRNSVFGGSISTSLIVASWASVRNILLTRGIPSGIIVIQSEHVEFSKPLIDDFYAALRPISNDRLTKFIAMINKFGKSRIKIEADVKDCKNNEVCASFTGEYVVLLNDTVSC